MMSPWAWRTVSACMPRRAPIRDRALPYESQGKAHAINDRLLDTEAVSSPNASLKSASPPPPAPHRPPMVTLEPGL